MGGCLQSIFNKFFWLAVFIIVCICGVIVECGTNVSFSIERRSVRSMLDDGEYKEVANELHDYFVDHFNAESKRVSTKMGTLADEAIKACLEVNDVENAKVIYRDYYEALPSFGRNRLFKYMVEHDMSDSTEYNTNKTNY